MDTKIKVCIDAWDDPAFRSAVEGAYDQVVAEGRLLDLPETASRVQHLLVAAGYAAARVDLERTVDEALVHVAHWNVHRGAVVPAVAR